MTVTEVIGGVTVEDPFRWLEDDADPAVVEWQRKANARTVEELAASPHAAAVATAVRSTFEDIIMCTAPERFGDIWFRKVLPPGRATVVLQVSDSPTGAGRILVDPAGNGANATIAATYPSPDGSLILAGILEDGLQSHRLIDVATGTVLRDDFGQFSNIGLCAWTPDNTGFFLTTITATLNADGQAVGQTQIWWQPVAGDAEQQQLELDHPAAFPLV